MQRLVVVASVAWVTATLCCSPGESLFSETAPLNEATGQGGGLGQAAAGGTVAQGGDGGTSTPLVCSATETPKDTCDPACDSCVNGECRIACNGPLGAGGANGGCEVVDCPAGLVCTVGCVDGGCEGATINCADTFQCNIGCIGDDACRNLTVNCAPGAVCKLVCHDGNGSCEGAKLNCDDNWCAAECDAGTNSAPTVNCDAANGCPCHDCQ